MNIRREPIYLSTSVWRALWMISKSVNEKDCTPDSLADAILRDVIKEKYPVLLEHQIHVAKLESELMKTLTKPEGFYES